MKKEKSKVESDVVEKVEEKKKPFLQKVEAFCKKYIYVIISALCVGVFILLAVSLSRNNRDVRKDNPTNSPGVILHEVKVHIEFVSNFIFSTYDVRLYAGDKKELMEHGKDADFTFQLEEGKNSLIFQNDEDSAIKNTVEIDVDSDMEVGYKINCYFDRITVEELYIDKDKPLQDGEIKIDIDKKYFDSKKYGDVVSKLEELGFTNISLKPLYDIVIGFTPEESIESVTIDGKDDYRKGDVFNKDVEVVVSYHLKESDDPSRVKPPYSSYSAKGLNYEEVKKAFEEAGFTNIVTKERTVSSGTNGDVYSVLIDSKSFDKKEDESYKKDVEVEITYLVVDSNIKEKPNRNDVVLDLYYARKAFENYGKSRYKYGFKCHWIMDLYREDEREDGSFYFQVGVTITNQYNAKYDAIAEGIVSGTNSSPKVTNFRIKE